MVGDVQPRKNQVGLVEAFAGIIRERPELRHQLVLVGKKNGYSANVGVAAMKAGIADRVHFTGFVSDEDLVQFYGACDLFVFPSFYEGFGIPILEAMACGRAVASSETSAMKEVADGAAILFDPYSKEQMARAMLDLLLDSELRSRMERLGSQRAAQFTWENSARKTLDVYYEVAGAGTLNRPVVCSKSASHS
jgi:glycosyltransferase involved in cell wall biosynthesis